MTDIHAEILHNLEAVEAIVPYHESVSLMDFSLIYLLGGLPAFATASAGGAPAGTGRSPGN
jgi:hypothetical protein